MIGFQKMSKRGWIFFDKWFKKKKNIYIKYEIIGYPKEGDIMHISHTGKAFTDKELKQDDNTIFIQGKFKGYGKINFT